MWWTKAACGAAARATFVLSRDPKPEDSSQQGSLYGMEINSASKRFREFR